jgi:hypothetical protein
MKRGAKLCSIHIDAGIPILKTAAPKPFKPINAPIDCKIMDNVYNSAGIYDKSLCIDGYARTYENARLKCLSRGMRLYRADSTEAKTAVLDTADMNWTKNSFSIRLHIAANSTGPLIVSNVNTSGLSEITTNSDFTDLKLSVCEYIDFTCKISFVQN